MKTKFKQTGMLISGALLFNACTGQPNIAKVNEQEVLKYETKYLQEYEQIKSSYIDNNIIKWIQASNKTKPCKVFVGTSKKDDRTLDSEYKIFWDGKCKNGYANGLGREFERGTLTDIEAIAIYSGKKEEPKYYIQKYNLSNVLKEGDLNNDYFVETSIKDDNINFYINYVYGYFGSKNKPALITYNSPLQTNSIYIKGYPNFAYQIFDFTNNEFDKRRYMFDLINSKNKKKNGFGFQINKNNIRYSGEMANGQFIRRVYLPQPYINKMGNILDEIKSAGQKAISSQNKALLVKKQYKKKICKDSVKINFIDNKEYKAICNEDKYYSNLKKKIDNKLAQINQNNIQKREQQNQQRLVNAREMEANAAQRRASAAESANFNQSMQNINQNRQMNQLNNNLFMMRMGY